MKNIKAKISGAKQDRRREQAKQDRKPRFYSVPFAGAMAGLNRNASYAAAKRGEIPIIKFGRLRKVPAAAWHLIVGE